MTQVNMNDTKLNVLKKLIDGNPFYEHLNPHHKSDYVNIAIDDFIMCKGKPFQNTMRNEFDRLLKIIVTKRNQSVPAQ